MDSSAITRFSASFANGSSEATDLVIIRCENGLYKIEGRYVNLHSYGFPSSETIERMGGAYADDTVALMDKLLLSCRQGWYHHYRATGHGSPDNFGLGSWSIHAEGEGRLERWEGLGHAPRGLDNVYAELVAFGMPPLKQGRMRMGSFERLCGPEGTTEFSPWHITCYRHILSDALESTQVRFDDADDEEVTLHSEQLFDEFIDDVTLYLEKCCPEALDQDALEASRIAKGGFGALQVADVSHASRREMLMLFGALVQASPRRDEVKDFVRDGVLERWCSRLDEIPREERAANRRIEEERNLALRDRIDESVRRFAARKKPFTSYDIAKDCGVTAQKASGRIRMLVKRGELRAIEGTLPRKYLAA